MSHTKKNYPCTQAELYAICTLGWNNYMGNLAPFTAFSPIYTAPFGTARLTEVETAQELPDEQTRDEVVETFHITLTEKGTITLNRWQDLKLYIIKAYPKNQQKPKLEAAGSDFYLKASQNNWDVLKNMLAAAKKFIAAKLTDLTANNNMPPAFQATFNTAKSDFETIYTNFLLAEENAVLQTEIKIKANNNLKDKLETMLADGQAINRDDDDMANLFTFDYLLGLVSGPGTAGVKGTCAPDTALQAGITIACPAQNKSVLADDTTAKYNLSLASGNGITIIASAPNHSSESKTVNIPVGTHVTVDFTLVPSPPPPPPPNPA